MNLDWNFYFDSWLIDKIPDGFEIRIEEHPSGVSINPPELTCYFGANPIYLYGLGKLYHEVLMSPDGITVYPSFFYIYTIVRVKKTNQRRHGPNR